MRDATAAQLPILRLGGAVCEKTRAAENRTTLRGIKGNGRLLTALRAINRHFDALADTGCLRGGDGRQSFVLRLLAGLTTLRFVLQPFVMKERLLAARPDEIFIAINTTDVTILKLRLNFCVVPFSVDLACRLSL